jgi:hypothetical protein
MGGPRVGWGRIERALVRLLAHGCLRHGVVAFEHEALRAAFAELCKAMREDLEVATREDFFMATDMLSDHEAKGRGGRQGPLAFSTLAAGEP